MFHVLQPRSAAHNDKRRKVTCTTCKLKGCVGRCHWESLPGDKPARAKTA